MTSQSLVLDDRISPRAPLLFALVVLLGFGLLYSLAGTALARSLFPWQAQGSMLVTAGQVRGSALVAQPFAGDRYFQPRPSAADYDPMGAAGSNQARSNPDLRKRIDAAIGAVAAREGIATADVPGELVTQSGSGMDPDISPRGARVQVARVAKARGLDVDTVAKLVAAHTANPTVRFPRPAAGQRAQAQPGARCTAAIGAAQYRHDRHPQCPGRRPDRRTEAAGCREADDLPRRRARRRQDLRDAGACPGVATTRRRRRRGTGRNTRA